MTTTSSAVLTRRQPPKGAPFAVAFGFALATTTAVGAGLPALAWTTTPAGAGLSQVRALDPAVPSDRTSSGLPGREGVSSNGAPVPLAQRIAELRSLSGLTTDQVGRIFGVSRRSVHNWINGNAMAPQHEERAAQMLSLVLALPGSSPDERRAALLDSSHGTSLFHQLVSARNEGARLQIAGVSARERIEL